MTAKWKQEILGNLLTVQNGYAFDSKSFNAAEGTPLIRIRDLKNGFETETRFHGTFDSRYLVNAGDLLIGMDGEFGCYEWKGKKALLNQRVCKLNDFTSQLLPKFLFHGVNSYLKAIEETTSFTTVKHISSKQITSIKFPVPLISEQKRIVAILDEAFEGIDAAVENAKKNLANARELLKNYLNSIFARGGEGWMERRLGDISKIQYGLSEKMNEDGHGYKIFRMGEVQNGQLIDTGAMKYAAINYEEFSKYKLRHGDVLFNRTNSYELVGKTGIFCLDGDYCFASYLVRVEVNRNIITPDFLNYFMNSLVFQGSVKQKHFVLSIKPT